MSNSPPCPDCAGRDAIVTDSRDNDRYIRRRRRCPCGTRFTTGEVIYRTGAGPGPAPPLDELAGLTFTLSPEDIERVLMIARSPALGVLAEMEAMVRRMAAAPPNP